MITPKILEQQEKEHAKCDDTCPGLELDGKDVVDTIRTLWLDLAEEQARSRRYREVLISISKVDLDSGLGKIVGSEHYEKAWLDCADLAKAALQADEGGAQ